jgi:MFS family permease
VSGPDRPEPAAAPRPASRDDPYAALRFADFRRFIVGNTLASMGAQMQTVAVGWYLYDRTGSALALGGVGLAQVAPIFALTLFAGHASDRFDRRRVVVVSYSLLVIASLGLAGLAMVRGPLVALYGMLVLNGIGRAFGATARDALAPQLLPIHLLGNGATWRSGTFQLAAVLGPAVGGLVIGLWRDATPAFVLAGVSAAAFALLMARVEPRTYAPTAGESPVQRLVAGARFVWNTRILIAIITLDMFAVLLGGATMLLPVYAKDILHVGPDGLGWLMAAPSLGAILVALAVAHSPMHRAGRALLWAVTGFGVATIVFGFSRSFALSIVALALVGGFDMVSVIIRSTLVQVLTPDELRGRVAAINALFIGTSNELGGFESGAAAALFGPVIAVVGGGVGSILVVLLVATIWPEVRRYGALQVPD